MKCPFRSVSRAHVFKLKSPDYSVTRFIKQSPRHLGFLEAKLSHLASVKIWMPTTKREDTEKIIEFHCRPIPVSFFVLDKPKNLLH